MGFSDIFKESVLAKFQTGDLTTASIAITFGMSLLIGLFIYFVYRMNTKSGFYNRGFNKSLAALPTITAAIMLAMGSNLTITLGMVGALSIVRFRNAVKDPMDLTYLFWSISAGIVVGSGLFALALILSLVIACLMFLLDLLPTLRTPSILIISAENVSIEPELMACIKAHAKFSKVRSRSITGKGAEWIFEMHAKNEQELITKATEITGVKAVHLMTHDGDVRF